MNAVELERYLTQFLQTGRDAQFRFDEATALEQYPNDATQDILHIAELAPQNLEGKDIVAILHNLRVQRRDAKKELEVTTIWKEWTVKHKKALDDLEQTLGAMRKVLRRQPSDAYRYKSSIIGEKGEWLKPDPIPEVNAFDEGVQLSFDSIEILNPNGTDKPILVVPSIEGGTND